jgi:hypothetical protein
MIAKLKRHILMVVALFLGYTGWNSIQADEADSAGLFSTETVLPEILPEDLRQRDKVAVAVSVADPFRVGDNRRKTKVDGPALEVMSVDQGVEVPILQLQSTMRLPDGGIAFFNHRRVNQGQPILPLADGNSPILKAVRGPLADVEYLGEVFTLDLNNLRSLKLGKDGGEILLPTEAEGSSSSSSDAQTVLSEALSAADGAEKQP